MYNLEHLKMLSVIVETGSFSACARKMGKVQSAVSQGIASLEIDMNCQLFDRSKRLPELTEQGRRLLAYATAVLAQVDEMESAVQAMQHEKESEIRLALDPVLMIAPLAAKLVQFAKHYPHTALVLNTMASAEVAGRIRAEEADIGLMFCDVGFPREVALCHLGAIEFVAIVAREHALAKLSSVTVGDLISERQMLLMGAQNTQQQLPQISAKAWYGDDFTALISLVESGVGWGYVPIHMVDESRAKILPVEFDHKRWSVPIDRVMRKGGREGEALQWLSKALTEVY
ncbi:MAG: LysR family transcriptional regulator [Pseudomonadales bacterium]